MGISLPLCQQRCRRSLPLCTIFYSSTTDDEHRPAVSQTASAKADRGPTTIRISKEKRRAGDLSPCGLTQPKTDTKHQNLQPQRRHRKWEADRKRCCVSSAGILGYCVSRRSRISSRAVLRLAGLLSIFGLVTRHRVCHRTLHVPSEGASWATSSHTRSRGNEILSIT